MHLGCRVVVCDTSRRAREQVCKRSGGLRSRSRIECQRLVDGAKKSLAISPRSDENRTGQLGALVARNRIDRCTTRDDAINSAGQCVQITPRTLTLATPVLLERRIAGRYD